MKKVLLLELKSLGKRSLEQANGGTIFLDEIGELPLQMQKNYLELYKKIRLLELGELNR
ncbi:sigma 54-interacting transcriptional regulator [Paraclostridium bifermentans]|nr:sigma 54-interacting transcriptional regulator [Paraclostridium bifermentans]